MLILATDLDRTLFPNGIQEYDGSMTRLRSLLDERSDIMLVYVTGRNSRETMDGIREFEAPSPAYAVCEVGTRIYRMEDGVLQDDPDWEKRILSRTRGWDTAVFRRELVGVEGLTMQEDDHQNNFKLSYYLDKPVKDDPRVREIRERMESFCPDADVVYSVDETRGHGLVDVLPRAATKVAGLEYLWEKFGLTADDVIYAGDSGNDLLPLTCGCRSILVRNAVGEVREHAVRIMEEKGLRERLYCASGNFGLNGYYVSGIMEGLKHFGITDVTH